MTALIRPAKPEDAPAIAAITNAMIRDTLVTFSTTEKHPQEIAARLSQSGPCFLVAEDHGTVLGFATYGSFRNGPGYRHTAEHSIHLAAEARGRGLGRALMTSLEKQARVDEIHILVAGISSANPGAVHFHTALGFQHVGRMPETGRKWGQWLDLILMQKRLG